MARGMFFCVLAGGRLLCIGRRKVVVFWTEEGCGVVAEGTLLCNGRRKVFCILAGGRFFCLLDGGRLLCICRSKVLCFGRKKIVVFWKEEGF